MSRQLDNLIFDRTEQDLSDETDKAFISYVDLNRVESACQYLSELLNVPIVTKTDWTIDGFRYESEMVRLRNNIKTLQDSYYKKPETPTVPYQIRYETIREANNIEKILWDIEDTYIHIIEGCHRLAFTLSRKQMGDRKAGRVRTKDNSRILSIRLSRKTIGEREEEE